MHSYFPSIFVPPRLTELIYSVSFGMNSSHFLKWNNIFRVTMYQNLYCEGVYLASSSMASAMGNILPAVTFAIAYIFRIEKINIRSMRSIPKIIGTVICVAGAVVMVLFKGPKILNSSREGDETWLLGCILLVASKFCWSAWLLLQVFLMKRASLLPEMSTLITFNDSDQEVVFLLKGEGSKWWSYCRQACKIFSWGFGLIVEWSERYYASVSLMSLSLLGDMVISELLRGELKISYSSYYYRSAKFECCCLERVKMQFYSPSGAGGANDQMEWEMQFHFQIEKLTEAHVTKSASGKNNSFEVQKDSHLVLASLRSSLKLREGECLECEFTAGLYEFTVRFMRNGIYDSWSFLSDRKSAAGKIISVETFIFGHVVAVRERGRDHCGSARI